MKVSIRKNKLKKGNSYTVFIDYGIVNGVRKRESLETFNSTKLAEDYKSKIQTQINNNSFIHIPDITFSNAIDEWMNNYVKINLEETTSHGYDLINNKYLKPCLGHLPLKIFNNPSSISIINNYYKYLISELEKEPYIDKASGKKKYKKNLSYNTVEHHKAQISGILTYFMKKGCLDRNICINTVIPRPNTKDIVVSNVEEIDEDDFFQEKFDFTTENAVTILNIFMNTEMMLPVALAIFLGLRRSEVLAILKNKVNKEKRLIFINCAKVRAGKKIIFKQRTKNKTSTRLLYIPKVLLNIIELDEKRQEYNRKQYGKDYYQSKFLCVKDTGEPFNPDYISRTFTSTLNKYIKEQKSHNKDFTFPHVTYHTLRHLNINALLENGAIITDVQRNAGHSDIHTTIGYTYETYKGKQTISEKTDEIYNNLLETS